MRRTRLILLGALLAVLAATTALASIGPAGTPIPVNTDTPNFDNYPDAAAQPGGSYTVVWGVGPPGDSVRSRRFDADDQPLGGEKLVSTSTEQEEIPAVAAAPDGSLVVAWESTVGDDAAAQRLAANGDKVGGQISVPESQSGINGQPDVAVAADGTFVVAWATENLGLKARRFEADGDPFAGGEVLVASAADADASAEPSVTIDSAGRVFVAWSDYTDSSVARIRGFTSALAPAWAGKPVIEGGVETQEPDVVATPEGFVVVFNQADTANQAYGRRFTAAGAPIAAAVALAEGDGRQPNVARGADGGLIAGWWNGSDGYARAFRSDLTGVGGPIVVAPGGPSPRFAAFSGEVIAAYHVVVPGNALDVFARRVPYDVSGAATPTPTATATPAPTTQPPAATPVPIATPAPKPAARKKPTLNAVAVLPSTRRCVSRRKFRIRLRHPRGARVKSAVVRVNGKRVATRRGRRVTAPVNLRGLPKGRFAVRITVKLADGRTVNGTRRYRTCTARKRR